MAVLGAVELYYSSLLSVSSHTARMLRHRHWTLGLTGGNSRERWGSPDRSHYQVDQRMRAVFRQQQTWVRSPSQTLLSWKCAVRLFAGQ